MAVTLGTPGWLAALMIASVSMLVGNKYVAVSYSASNLTVLFQQIVACGVLEAGRRVNFFKIKPLSAQQFQQLLVPACLQTVQMLSSMKSLAYVAVATTVVFRNVSTLAVAAIEIRFFGQVMSQRVKLTLLVILCGAVLYALQDLQFSPVGYMWLVLNTVAYTCNNVYSKKVISSMEQTGDGVGLVTAIISLPVLLLYAVYFGELPDGIYQLFHLPYDVLTVFLFLGLMGTLIGLSYSNLYKLISATSVVVAANFNKVVSILLAYFIFRKPLSSLQLLGLAICIFGGTAYSMLLRMDKEESQKANAALQKDEEEGTVAKT